MDPQVLSERIARLPCWAGGVDVSVLHGGMTNRNFLVRQGDGQRFVVRCGHDLPAHGVMRFNELAAARAAYAAGLSPEVVYATEGMLVSRFVDGRTLGPEDVRDPARLTAIVSLLHRCHEEIPHHMRGPSLVFWVFQVVRNYLGTLGDSGRNPLGLDLADLARRSAWLEQRVGPVNIVFGHNDLLAANLIDDGARLWLIDWDYAGFNSPLFDLANLSSNNAFSTAQDAALLRAYFGEHAASQRRGFEAMKCASLLRESLWAAESLVGSSIDYDYAAYAQDYLQRFERKWQELQAETD
jgi:thiamine kinase-like enzyme